MSVVSGWIANHNKQPNILIFNPVTFVHSESHKFNPELQLFNVLIIQQSEVLAVRMYYKVKKPIGLKNTWVFSCLLGKGVEKMEDSINSDTKVSLPLTSVTAMVINIITIFHSRNGFNFHFILQQIIWEMINEIFNYRLSLS